MNTPEAQTKDNDTVHNVFIAIICLMTLVAAGCRNAVSENHDTATEMDTAAEEGSDIVVSSDTDSATNRDLMGVAAQMDWVMLEPATFTIGSPESEWGHGLDEVHHQVTHIHRYEITSTEVTCKQWEALADDEYQFECGGLDGGDNMPASTIDIEAVQAWLDRLSISAGLSPCYASDAGWETPLHCPGYRLPTESEWERAARGGDKRATYNGDLPENDPLSVLAPIAWCGDERDTEYRGGARPVAMGAPNSLGLYDMIGNVYEFAAWDGFYRGDRPASPYADMVENGNVALRGGYFGSIENDYRDCRAADRYHLDFLWEGGRDWVGFRPVRTLDGGELPTRQTTNWCPYMKPMENCAVNSFYREPVFHTMGDDAKYVDMDGISTTVLALGNSNLGPFLEIFGQTEIQTVFPSDVSSSPKATLLAAGEESLVVTVLCDAESCSLYHLSLTDEAHYWTLMSGGEVPSWLDEVKDLIVSENPLEIVLAGNGIAVFDGEEWSEAIAPTPNGFFNAMEGTKKFPGADGNVPLIAAVGDAGRVAIRERGVWREDAPFAGQTFSSVHIYDAFAILDSASGIVVGGEDGFMLMGPLSDYSVCHFGDMDVADFRVTSGIDFGLALTLTDGADTTLYLPGPSDGTHCRHIPMPPNWIKNYSFQCGMNSNEWYLSSDGVYKSELSCLFGE